MISINNKIFLSITIFFTLVISLYYREQILLFLIPIVFFIKIKFLYYVSTIITTSTTFFASSKTKIFLFIKTLTIYKALIIGIKRFIIDNYFSKWLADNIINPIKTPIIHYMKFFFKLGFKTKVKRIAYFLLPMSVIVFIAQMTGVLESVLLLAELKALIIGFFKIAWIFFGHIANFLSTWVFALLKNTWLVSILEIFALSWLMNKIDKIPFIGSHLVKFFNFLSKKISKIFEGFFFFYNKYIYSHISLNIKNKMENIGDKLFEFLENTKHENEIFIIKNFINEVLTKENFIEYYKKIKIEHLYNKNEIYKLINKKTKDNVDIKFYFNVNVNSLEEDILIIESVASCNSTGNENTTINKHSFWVLNLSRYNIELLSLSNDFTNKNIKPGKLRLIHSLKQDMGNAIALVNKERLLINKIWN